MPYKGKHRKKRGRYVPKHSAGKDPLVPPQAVVVVPATVVFSLFAVPTMVSSTPSHLLHGLKPVVRDGKKMASTETSSGVLEAKPEKKKETPIPQRIVRWEDRVSSAGEVMKVRVVEDRSASQILASYIKKYPILRGSTVTYGDAKGYQAICYYRSGRIVISKDHTASLERIIAHEVQHILDWRNDRDIDRPD